MTAHIAPIREMFMDYQEISDETGVKGIGSTISQVVGKGTVHLEFDIGMGKPIIHELRDVLHLPNADNCLLSISRLADTGGYAEFMKNSVTIKSKYGNTIGEGDSQRGLYILKAKAMSTQHSSYTAITNGAVSWEDWHRHFGHIGFFGLQKLRVQGLVTGFNIPEDSTVPSLCDTCITAKLTHTLVSTDPVIRSLVPGEKTHSDLWGPYRTASLQGSKYYITFTDDCTRHISVLFLKSKDKAVNKISKYLNWLTTKFDRLVYAFIQFIYWNSNLKFIIGVSGSTTCINYSPCRTWFNSWLRDSARIDIFIL